MTRAHTTDPVWTWHCDRCGRTSGDLSYGQSELPNYAAMRARGWFIAEKFGDLCPDCNTSDGGAA
ncbi:hypothetical protein UQW22_10015 [Isoptericola halotolerans]|uniref:hypothetical protein n=1 Tax=Isoptericola halotolerans TaxID=300560 RepID=UPI003890D734